MVNLSKFSKPAAENTWQTSYVIILHNQRRILKHATIRTPSGARPTKQTLSRPFLTIIRTRVAIRPVRLFATLHSNVEVEVEDLNSIADMQTVASFEWRDENAAVVSLQYQYFSRPEVLQTVAHEIVIALEFDQQTLCNLLLKMFQRPLLDAYHPVRCSVLQNSEEWTPTSRERGLAGVTHINIADERRGCAPHHVVLELNGMRVAVISEVGDCFADVLATRIVDNLNHPQLSNLPLLLDSAVVSPMDNLDSHGIRFDSVIRVSQQLVPLWIFIENRFQMLYVFDASYDWHAFHRQYCLLYEADAPQEMVFQDAAQPGATPNQGDVYVKYPPTARFVPLRCAGIRRFFITDSAERFYNEWLISGFDANGIELLHRNYVPMDLESAETGALGIPVLGHVPSLALRAISLDTAIGSL